jgi:peptidoglycan/xylan/chitin deacetylase (PgdA/CDA1 family)
MHRDPSRTIPIFLVGFFVVLLALAALAQPPAASVAHVAAMSSATSTSAATDTPTREPTRTSRPSRTPTPEPTRTPTRTPRPTRTPTPEPTPGPLAAGVPDYVPILMYHYIRTVDPQEDQLGYNLSVTPEIFEEHIVWLRKMGYTSIRMDRLSDCLRGLRECPDKPVVLTFDDGYADAATEALPILERHGFTATFYVVIDFVGRPGYMTWEQVKLLHESGMEIGSHSVSHPDLTARDPEVAFEEISRSRAILEQQLGAPVRSFSYPIGSYDETVAEFARQVGYTSAVTVYPGSDMTLMYELPRRRIMGGEPLEAIVWYVAEPALE